MKSRFILVLWASVTAFPLCCAEIAAAQETPAPAGAASTKNAQQATSAAVSALRLTLEDSIARARKNSTQFQAAQTEAAIARQDRYQAATALLPSVTYDNQALYTQLTNGNVRFIANNAAH